MNISDHLLGKIVHTNTGDVRCAELSLPVTLTWTQESMKSFLFLPQILHIDHGENTIKTKDILILQRISTN